jgi:diadenosine tetraphosphatase ApaH/serine/threonine PP2A family protein phosphatase
MKILVVSDVHANQVAFEAVLAAAPAYDALWNLGDTVGYGPQPGACIDLMVEREATPSLAGNHDLAAIGRLDLGDFNPIAQTAARWTAAQLRPDQRAYLESLPSMATAAEYTLAHGSPRSPVWEYVTSDVIATACFAFFETGVCFIGHSHLALFAALDVARPLATIKALRAGETLELGSARYLVNPGSVGQPRDGDPRAAYAVLDTDRHVITAHRVAYDIRTTQRQMERVGLPDPLIRRLRLGR